MKKNDFLKILLQLLIFILLSTSATAFANGITLQKQLESGDKAILTFASATLLTMTEIPFSIELYTATGEAISDAEVTLHLTMPAMPMPPNNPRTLWQDNSYQGSAIFTMAGIWETTMTLKRPDQTTIESSLGLVQVRMK